MKYTHVIKKECINKLGLIGWQKENFKHLRVQAVFDKKNPEKCSIYREDSTPGLSSSGFSHGWIYKDRLKPISCIQS